jgi:hypothetical protein
MTSFQNLPKELIGEIFTNLTPKELLSQCTINKQISKLCKDERFWAHYVQQVYQ